MLAYRTTGNCCNIVLEYAAYLYAVNSLSPSLTYVETGTTCHYHRHHRHRRRRRQGIIISIINSIITKWK